MHQFALTTLTEYLITPQARWGRDFYVGALPEELLGQYFANPNLVPKVHFSFGQQQENELWLVRRQKVLQIMDFRLVFKEYFPNLPSRRLVYSTSERHDSGSN